MILFSPDYASLLAIFIACLGLLGLAAFSAQQRQKEIGIRNVMGASVGSITLLLSKDLLKLVAIGMLLATPVAWYGMSRWKILPTGFPSSGGCLRWPEG